MITDYWHKCYPSAWKGVIIPEAMAHPAKYSNKLIRRIYEHLVQEGWVQAGDRVVDPFGGVALGALDAMRLGLDWYGCELEPRFHELGNKNIDLWNSRYSQLPRWGSAHLMNGDSRHLVEILGQHGVSVAVSSPPYADGSQHTGGNDPHPEKMQGGMFHGVGIAGAISSPPYAGSVNQGDGANDSAARLERKAQAGIDNANAATRGGPNSVLNQPQVYGQTPGQLGAMKAGGFDAAISSPPFLQSEGGASSEPKPGGAIDHALRARHAAGNKSSHAYGTTEGQLSSMKDGSFDVAISSPPYSAMQVEKNTKSVDRSKQYESYKRSGGGQTYEQFCKTQELHSQGYGHSEGQLSDMPGKNFEVAISSPPFTSTVLHDGGPALQQGGQLHSDYGSTEGQMANMPAKNFDASISSPPYDEARVGSESGQEHCGHGDQYGQTDGQLGGADDFWMAARAIVEQVHQALAPGGHAVWVTKRYVKNGKIVEFSQQWAQLCEAVGFKVLHMHRAMLVHHKGAQHTLDGELIQKVSESKSFFRRLAEKNGSPKIDWEDVICMVKE